MKFLLSRLQLGLGLATFGAAILFWLSVHHTLGRAGSAAAYGPALIFFTLWMTGLAFAGLFAKSSRWFAALAAGGVLSSVAFFGLPAALVPDGIVLGLVISYAFVSALVGWRWMREDAANRLTPRYSRTLQIGLARFISPPLLVVAALFYLFTPASVSDRLLDFTLPRPVFDAIAAPLQGVIAGGTLGQTLGPGATDLFNQGQFKDELYTAVSQTLRAIARPYRTQFKILLAIGLFLTFRAIASPYTALLTEFILLLFRGLVRAGVIEKKTFQREQITYEFK